MDATSPRVMEDLLKETRTFGPPETFKQKARANDPSVYERAKKDPQGFWAERARELYWRKPFTQILDWKLPHARWFWDGQINACENCVDRHVLNLDGSPNRRNQAAILWEGEPGDRRTLTYWDLYKEVQRFANVLRSKGVKRGDRVAVYMPLVPELVITCLATARIGAVHSVVFGGFSGESLRDRILDAGAKVLVTADHGWRRGKKVLLKEAADAALEGCPGVTAAIVFRREPHGAPAPAECRMKAGRDSFWDEEMKAASAVCPVEDTNAEDLLFTLYTSGTTGKPKGIVHTTGGYLTGVHATSRWIFDLKDEDVFWCTADVGWITGHSYVIYGPLSNGATVLMYEGAPDWPEKDRFWKIIEQYGVTIFYTAPTAIRAFMKWGTEWPRKADLSSLRLLGSVGEPINPEAWLWYQENIGGGRCPVVDTWWQTETGAILVSPLPGITTTKPGSATRAFPGISVEVLDEAGRPVQSGGGYVAVTQPWPSMLRTIYNDDERYLQQYWSKWDGKVYFTGDGAKLDADGYLWFLGRVDDVMNVAGHRIGTMELESALVDHRSVAEAAVVGVAHEIKGTAVAAFVTLKEGFHPSENLAKELKEHVANKIGHIARPDQILFSGDLPKTRSGKIMRRLLRDIAEGRALGDVTTLADPSVVDRLKKQYEENES